MSFRKMLPTLSCQRLAAAFGLILSLALSLVASSGWTENSAPVTAKLDLISAAPRGGLCQVIWVGIPQITPDSAALTFYLKQPGSEKETAFSQPLTFKQGQESEVEWNFPLPVAGTYRVSALLKMNVAGGCYTHEEALTLSIPQAGNATLVQAKPAAIVPQGQEIPSSCITPAKAAPAAPSFASTAGFTVSGTFKYTDKTYNTTGFTGTAQLPVRRMKVEIRDVNSGGTDTILGTTKTDSSGFFSFYVPNNIDVDNTGRDIQVRLYADGDEACVNHISSGTTHYFYTKTYQDWAGGGLNIGTAVFNATDSGLCNIFDVMLQGYDFVKALLPSGTAIPKITCRWEAGTTEATGFASSTSTITVNADTTIDADDFDDGVLLYMYGLHIIRKFSYTKATPVSHSWSSHISKELAWEAGFAGFFSRAVRNNQYMVDISAHAASVLDAELPTSAVTGEDCEGAVAATLWDIFDSHNDGQDTLSDGMGHIWSVFTHYFKSTSACVFRDFYNGWLDSAFGSVPQLQSIMKEHGIVYTDTTVSVGGTKLIGNISTAGGSNWFYFTIATAGAYTIETWGGTLTGMNLWLYGPNSQTTLIAQSTSGGLAHLVWYLNPGTYYIKVQASSSLSTGSYSIDVLTGPTLSAFSINAGAASTVGRLVTLNLTASGSPAYYMASESSSFAAATWIAYTSAPTFTLSMGNGTKTVYVKLRNAAGGESVVLSDTITLSEPITPVTVNGSPVAGNISPAGDYDWYSFTVTASGVYTIQTAPLTLVDTYLTLYGPDSMTRVVAEDDNSGNLYASEIITLLSPGTYYINARAAAKLGAGTYNVAVMRDPILTYAWINKGAVATASRTVTLETACTGTPTYIMISESPSFSGAVWQPYAPVITLTLSAGTGTKTIYMKVRDGANIVSSVTARAIYLQ